MAAPRGRCEWRHHVFTLNASRNRHSMAKMGPAGPCPKKRNVQSTWGLPRHMGGVPHSAHMSIRCDRAVVGMEPMLF